MVSCGRSDFGRAVGAGLVAVATVVAGTDARPQERSEPPPAKPVVDVVGTTLRARLPDGSVREGAALVGAVLVVAVGGQTVRVRIAGVEKDAGDPRGEVLLYDFRLIAPDGDETPLCTPDPDGRQLGLALAGRSDPAGMLSASDSTTFELVCTSGAQGKCVRFGYAPWRQAPDGRPLRDWYNTCVRVVRGDYCGDGRPYTRDGTWIDIYDRIGVQKSDEDPTLRFEAAWGPGGAVCVARTRLPDLIDLDGLARACPRLAGRLGPAACQENVPGGLILNRSR